MWNSNSPSSTSTICSASWTWVGATVWGANDTKLAIAFPPSTGRNDRPGTNSTGSMSSTLTNRPGPAGTPWAWLVKWAAPLLVTPKPTYLVGPDGSPPIQKDRLEDHRDGDPTRTRFRTHSTN